MRRSIVLSMLVLLSFLLAACGAASPEPARVEQAAVAEAPAPLPAADMAGGGEASEPGQPQPPIPDPRKLIYQANMSMVVKDPAQTMQQIQALASSMGGYVSNSQLSQYVGDQVRGNMTVRVPVESYSDMLAQLRGLAVRVLNETSNANDVTAEYSDLEAQLRNLEAAEKELQALLTDVRERPNATAEDILEVYNALAAKRGEIEQVKGRMQYLGNLVALSTITVDLAPDEITKPLVEEGWQPLVTLKDAFRTLVDLLQGLVDLLINLLVVVLPVLVILALPLVFLFFLVRWLRQRRKAPPQA